MKKIAAFVACFGALMSCGSSDSEKGFVSTPGPFAGSGEIAAIPLGEQRYDLADVVTDDLTIQRSFPGSNAVNSIAYNPDTEILTILGDPFDLAGTFRRAPSRDVRGFAAFENDGGARNYLALVRTDTDHGLAAGVVGTPRRLNNEFGGTVLARGATPDLPSNREVRHVGDYAGVRNVGTNDGIDMSNSFLHRVEGQVQLDLDFFTDSVGVEGAIFNRRNMDATTTRTVEVEVPVLGQPGQTTTETREVAEEITYADIVLEFTNIDASGNFAGNAISGNGSGFYDGMIAGDNAAASAGIVVIVEGLQLERGGFIARAVD